MTLFVLTGTILLAFYVGARWLVRSKFGRILQAIRDAESRVTFCGYNPLPYKLTIWTISAVMCGNCRRAVRPAGGHHQPERDEHSQQHRDGDLGRCWWFARR